jgi:hypothetical protein
VGVGRPSCSKLRFATYPVCREGRTRDTTVARLPECAKNAFGSEIVRAWRPGSGRVREAQHFRPWWG